MGRFRGTRECMLLNSPWYMRTCIAYQGIVSREVQSNRIQSRKVWGVWEKVLTGVGVGFLSHLVLQSFNPK